MPAPNSVGGWEKIYESILGANTTSIDWTGIPASYKLLWINFMARSTTTGNTSNLALRFNSDSGANYGLNYLSMQNSATSGSGSTGNSSCLITVVGASGDAAAFSHGNMYIGDYANTTPYKVAVCQQGGFPLFATATSYLLQSIVNEWHSTVAINEITWSDSSGNQIASGSRFTCYGMP